MSNLERLKQMTFFSQLQKTLSADGGIIIVERLMRLFGVKSRIELSVILGNHSGSFSTWQTRNTTPYEMLLRIHIATGVPLKYLCFGDWKGVPDIFSYSSNEEETPASEDEPLQRAFDIQTFRILNGNLMKIQMLDLSQSLFDYLGATNDCIAIEDTSTLHFVDRNQQVVTQGNYLFLTNNVHQIGPLKLMPNGKVYFYDDAIRSIVDNELTCILGKVIAVLNR